MFVAAGLLSLGRRGFYVACTLALPAAISLGTYYTQPIKHAWRDAATFVEAHALPTDLIVFDNDNNEAPFSRYATGPQPHLRVLATQDTARLVGTAHHRGPHVDVADAILVHDRVWLILSDAAPGSDARDAKQLEGFTVTAHAALRGIDARLYERLHPQTEPP